jgi:hypothetical protein
MTTSSYSRPNDSTHKTDATTRDPSARTRNYFESSLPSLIKAASSNYATVKSLGPEVGSLLEGHSLVVSSGLNTLLPLYEKGSWDRETRELIRANISTVANTNDQVSAITDALKFLQNPCGEMTGYTCRDGRTSTVQEYLRYLDQEQTENKKLLTELKPFWRGPCHAYDMSSEQAEEYMADYRAKISQYQDEFRRSLELGKQKRRLMSCTNALSTVMTKEQISQYPVPRVSQVRR